MISITLKDGSKKEYKKNISVIDVAKDISEGFARNVIAASFNGIPVEISTKLNNDGSLELYTWEDNEGKKAVWHSSSHVLAQALEELYPGIKLTIGPAIKNGFYYDVDFNNHVLTDKDFELLATGNTVGVFQLESTGMRESLMQMKPNHLEDIIALVALYRP